MAMWVFEEVASDLGLGGGFSSTSYKWLVMTRQLYGRISDEQSKGSYFI